MEHMFLLFFYLYYYSSLSLPPSLPLSPPLSPLSLSPFPPFPLSPSLSLSPSPSPPLSLSLFPSLPLSLSPSVGKREEMLRVVHITLITTVVRRVGRDQSPSLLDGRGGRTQGGVSILLITTHGPQHGRSRQ